MPKEKDALRRKTEQHYYTMMLHRGKDRILTEQSCQVSFAVLCVGIALLLISAIPNAGANPFMAALLPLFRAFYLFVWALLCLVAVLLFGYIPQGWQMYDDLTRAGIVNHVGEAPLLIDKRKVEYDVLILKFFIKGFPLEEWKNSISLIESALNKTVLKVEQGEDNQIFCVQVTPAQNPMSGCILFRNSFMPQTLTKIAVGIDAAGRLVCINLEKAPHWLIGAVTGGGKTNLLQLIVYQLRGKGFDIYLADFKGVDFPDSYKQPGHYAEDLDAMQQMTEEVVNVLDTRRAAFAAAGCNDIAKYNADAVQPLPRIVIVVDETSIVLDTTGRTKQEKEAIAVITGNLLRISRLGRSMGIHLMLATQRCDVASVPGALKTNLPGRIAGHAADMQSSMVILDDGSATKLPAVPGRFLMRDTCGEDIIFQAYFMAEQDELAVVEDADNMPF